MEEAWDHEGIDAKARAKASGEGILSRLTRWRHYDVTFGLVMPVACFALEFVLLPALGWLPGLIFFHRFRLFGYGVVVLELATLMVWLRFGGRLGRWTAGVAGVLLAGALFAGVLGLVLLPFAIPGVLVLGIGALGFVPLLTSHVYYRNGKRALRQATGLLGDRARYEALLWGAVLAYAIPGLAQARVTSETRAALRDLIGGDDSKARAAVARLHRYRWVADFDPMRRAYQREPDGGRRERLARDYQELTGDAIWNGPERLFEYDGPERVLDRGRQ